ncbi:hypothetical protein Tco_1315802 [Tanacetum coccineum]
MISRESTANCQSSRDRFMVCQHVDAEERRQGDRRFWVTYITSSRDTRSVSDLLIGDRITTPTPREKDSMDGGGGGLCFPRGLGSLDRIESGNSSGASDPSQIMAPTTRRGPNAPVNDTNPNNITPESIQAMIDQALLRNSTNGDGSHSSHGDNRRNVQTARPCFYADFMKCQPLNFKGAEGVVGLTRWIEKMESVFNISGCAVENQVKFAT